MDDIKPVKTIILSNNDRFYFSGKFDEKHIEELIGEAKNLYASIRDIPILPNKASQIEEEIMVKSIHGTAAIEGNPLSENDVNIILTKSDQIRGNRRAQQEIVNLKALYQYLKKAENYKMPTEELVLTFQELVTKNISDSEDISGKIRSAPVKVGDESHGGTYRPPTKSSDIKKLLSMYFEFLNSKEILALDPIIRAALAHYHLALIHPFKDGNGRTARFLEAYIIQSAGIKYIPVLLSNYYYRHMDDYYWAFSLSEKNKERDITPFIEFVYKGVVDSLLYMKEYTYAFIRVVFLQQHYSNLKTNGIVSPRQYNLLMTWLSYPQSISFADIMTNPQFLIIYTKVSPRTVQRDLKKLTAMNLLKKNEDGTYELNLRALG